MWFNIKETAKNMWNASKQMIDKRTPVQKLIDEIADSQEQIIPTQKLTQLSTLTYELQSFNQILNIFIQRLRVFHYNIEKSHQTLNILIATNYIIKHGATAFVDELRLYIDVFQKYQTLKEVHTYEDARDQAKLDYNLQKIKSRANHIQILLKDKQKLLKEKQLSMLVKQKLKLYEKDKLSELKNESTNSKPNKIANSQDVSQKLEGIMERYVWKYVDKLDDTLEAASQKIMEQIDKYVIGEEMPEKFEIDEDDSEKEKKEEREKEKQKEEELMKRLEEQAHSSEVPNSNLLDFEEMPVEKEKEEKVKEQSLI